MDIFKIVCIGIICTIIIVMFKNIKSEYAVIISIVGSLIIMFFVLSKLSKVVLMITSIINKTGVDFKYLSLILKITGIAYLVSIGSNICKDAGQNALASKIDIAGKVIIVTYSMPILGQMLDVLGQLIC
ncbi:MAG: stage III sporulation protein AD [Clostridia bacterium]